MYADGLFFTFPDFQGNSLKFPCTPAPCDTYQA
jgi:hypothetical protein